MNDDNIDIPFVIREASIDDRSFVINSWLQQIRDAMPWSFIKASRYYDHQTKLIESILSRAETYIACCNDDSSLIYGYVCFEKLNNEIILHWGSVKSGDIVRLRGRGIMTALMQTISPTWRTDLIICTHIGKSFISLKKRFNLTFDPYILATLEQNSCL